MLDAYKDNKSFNKIKFDKFSDSLELLKVGEPGNAKGRARTLGFPTINITNFYNFRPV